MREIFELEKDQAGIGEKVTTLSEAVAACIKPGLKLHINTGAYANAVLREIIKQYWDQNPQFTLISSGVTTPFKISLACSGLVKKVITTNHSYTYPIPRPIPLLQKMQQEGVIEIESWSLYSLEQRLMAGALGVGFMPTQSLMGSSLAEENAESFKIISNPFNEEKSIGVVKALCPDISVIHGCVADRDGNTILAPPYFGSIWGPRASRGGVIVTVEKIVSTEFIRRHSALVKIPGHLVKFVCPVPLGAHPQGLAAESIGVVEGYGEDYEFLLNFIKASQSSDRLREWIGEWVLECRDQDDYLSKLGSEKIFFLKGKSSGDAWKYEQLETGSDFITSPEFNSTEMMVVAAAREIREIVTQKSYKTILAGMGSPGLAAWLAFYILRQNGYELTMLTGAGQAGYAPRPGDPFLITLSNVMTCTMLTDTVEIYGTYVGGANNRCLSILGTAQIDEFGNINTVKMGGTNLIGLGGAGDAVNARETLVVAKQSRSRFMAKVPFIGCPGRNIKTLVTDLGVFKKLRDAETFTLTKYFSSPAGRGQGEILEEIKDRCGWTVRVAEVLEEVSPPTSDEVAILRYLDPQALFIGE